MTYNSGVIFFSPKIDGVVDVFSLWNELALKYRDIFKNDQEFLSLSMELLNFNPYTLSINYNYRGTGNLISGDVKIWHSHIEMPKDINDFEVAWPPRRVTYGQIIFPNKKRSKLNAFISKRMKVLKKNFQAKKLLNRNGT